MALIWPSFRRATGEIAIAQEQAHKMAAPAAIVRTEGDQFEPPIMLDYRSLCGR